MFKCTQSFVCLSAHLKSTAAVCVCVRVCVCVCACVCVFWLMGESECERVMADVYYAVTIIDYLYVKQIIMSTVKMGEVTCN